MDKLHKFKSVGLILLFALAALCASGQDSDEEWTLEKDEKNIQVFTRKVDASNIKEFKARTVIDADIEDLIRALEEFEAHPKWMSDITYVEQVSDDPYVLLYHLKLPFPFKDRYVVIESESEWEEQYFRMNMTQAAHEPEDTDGRVRIPYVNGYWHFEKLDEGMTEVVYQFLSDPGGSVPDWLVNAFVVQSPYKTLTNLRKRLE